MGTFWLKTKIWSKIILAAALAIFALLFVYNNKGKPIDIWFWGSVPTTVLRLLLFTVVFSVVATFLVSTAFRTIRQMRELAERTRHEKLQNDLADVKAHASMLKTKPLDGV